MSSRVARRSQQSSLIHRNLPIIISPRRAVATRVITITICLLGQSVLSCHRNVWLEGTICGWPIKMRSFSRTTPMTSRSRRMPNMLVDCPLVKECPRPNLPVSRTRWVSMTRRPSIRIHPWVDDWWIFAVIFYWIQLSTPRKWQCSHARLSVSLSNVHFLARLEKCNGERPGMIFSFFKPIFLSLLRLFSLSNLSFVCDKPIK